MEWSQSVKISLRSRGKFKYIIGTARPQLEIDPKYEIWEAQNSMIMSWLLNSMQPEIRKTYLLLPTARDIWEAVNKTYSKVGFTSQIFQIKPQIMNTKQGTPSVTEDYNSLKAIDGVRSLPKHRDGICCWFKEVEGHAGNGTSLSIFVGT